MKDQLASVFFCAGARNHKLIESLSQSQVYYEVDERIASFKALGLCKSLQKPVAICTTSGTAVSECLSAMIEAYYSEAPLILISADRPKELQGTGAPQTIDHEIITRNYRRSFFEITFEEFESFDFTGVPLPLHLNVLIRSKDEALKLKVPPAFNDFPSFMKASKTPLFIFSHARESLRELVIKFKDYGIPFYAEALSGAHDLSVIKTEKTLVTLLNQGSFDSVVRIGHTPLSKAWRILESMNLPVYSFDPRGLKALSHGSIELLTPKEILSNFQWWECLSPTHARPLSDETPKLLVELARRYPEAELSYFKLLHDQIPEHSLVYLGNSLPIRYFEMVQTKELRIHANRGVNGIDGQLASAIGLSLSTKDPVYCIIGDMTLTYDLSSLASLPENLKLIVMNNRGGRIFETLKLDQRLVMEHDRTFQDIARGFNLTYSRNPRNLGTHQFIELFPSLEQSRKFLQGWSL